MADRLPFPPKKEERIKRSSGTTGERKNGQKKRISGVEKG